jgi:hypothetical protein
MLFLLRDLIGELFFCLNLTGINVKYYSVRLYGRSVD